MVTKYDQSWAPQNLLHCWMQIYTNILYSTYVCVSLCIYIIYIYYIYTFICVCLSWKPQKSTLQRCSMFNASRSVFLAGCVAGSGSSFINTPTELVKCLAQTNLKNKGTLMEEWHLVEKLEVVLGMKGMKVGEKSHRKVPCFFLDGESGEWIHWFASMVM